MPSNALTFLAAQPVVPTDGATMSMIDRLCYLKEHFAWDPQIFCTVRLEHAEKFFNLLEAFRFAPKLAGNSLQYTIRSLPVQAFLGAGMDRFIADSWHIIQKTLIDALASRKPGIVFSNMRDLPALSAAINFPHLVFLTENEFVRPGEAPDPAQPFTYGSVYSKVKNIAVASTFLKESFLHHWKMEASVFANPIDVDSYCGIRPDDANDGDITLLHALPHKGVDLFLDIAANMPQRSFCVAGAFGPEYRQVRERFVQFPNLTAMPFQPDARNLYARSRLVLVPSLWQEVFSRVVVESCASGIPFIASDVGGIREAGEDAGDYINVNCREIGKPVPKQNIVPWLAAIERLDDKGVYTQRRKKCLERAARYRERVGQDMHTLNEWARAIAARQTSL